MASSSGRSGTWLFYLAFFLSGAAGLGYEVVWTRLFSTALGHEYPSLLAVVAAFFGGVALGAWAADRAISRSQSPGRVYALLEVLIGLWAGVSLFAIPWVSEQAAGWIGLAPGPVRHWALSFLLPWLTLLPATAAMGATLPAIERLVARMRSDGRRVSGLYALNTAGAAAGILLSHLVLVPGLGLRGTLLSLGALNLLCALLVLLGSFGREKGKSDVVAEMEGVPERRRLFVLAFSTGLLGIGYEVLGIRVMSQVLENTVYSFAAALIAYLLGTAAGAAWYQARPRQKSFAPLLQWLFPAIAGACILGILVLARSRGLYDSLHAALGGGSWAAMATELALALSVFGLPAALMGASFSHLMQAARGTEGGVGAMLGINTLGSSLAALVFGVAALSIAGSEGGLVIASLGFLALCPHRPLARLAIGTFVALSVLTLSPRLWLIDDLGGRVLVQREGHMAAVAVLELPDASRALKVNDEFRMGSTGPGAFGARRLGHLPVLLHPDPEEVLVLGLGTGITLAAVAEHPGVRVTGVELVPEVVEVMDQFAEDNAAALENPLVEIHAADARRFVRATDETYDVIIADLYHPARDGSGSLYTREHFEAIRERLAPDGLFCQWLPLYQIDEEVLAMILRTFLEVFPDARAHVGWFNVTTPTLGLVAGALPHPADLYTRRVQSPALGVSLSRVGLRDGYQLLGTAIASTEGLRTLAGTGRINTDDHPLIAYIAPQQAYTTGDGPGRHLDRLLELGAPSVADLLEPAALESDFAPRLDDYLTARDEYLQGAMATAAGYHPRAMELYLRSTRTSPDFRTSYEWLLLQIREMATTRPNEARALLETLQEARPERRDAALLLNQLFR